MTHFEKYTIEHILREENENVNALIKFTSLEADSHQRTVYFKVLGTLSIDAMLVAPISYELFWTDSIKAHLETGGLPNNVLEENKLTVRVLMYALIDGILYKKSSVIPYIKCLR